MSEERKKILEMLSAGKITVEEAEKLLNAVGPEGTPAEMVKKGPRYLKAVVNSAGGDRVNVRVPLQLVRAGIKFQALLPENARAQITEKFEQKGIDLDFGKLKPEDLDEFVSALQELQVDVTSENGDEVRVFCE
ncbi:MAG: hypothetical protein JW909_12240 [Planctomycetes bacterium]|nr:hypothetical protein [Planctomycetota bacterium]